MPTEIPHRRIAHQPAGAGDQDLLARQKLLAHGIPEFFVVRRRGHSAGAVSDGPQRARRRTGAVRLYGTGKFLRWLIGAGIRPQIPVWDKSTRDDGTFSRADFTFDQERDVYVCPAGNLLTTTGSVGADLSCAIWRSSATADHRSSRGAVRRRHHARSHATSTKMPVIKLARRWGRRSCKKVEMRFAHLKTHRRFERMRLRGLSGARDTPLCKTLRPSRAASGDRR